MLADENGPCIPGQVPGRWGAGGGDRPRPRDSERRNWAELRGTLVYTDMPTNVEIGTRSG